MQIREMSGSCRSVWVQILTTESTRRALVLGCLLQGIQQLAGINTVMYYSASIIQMSGVREFSIAIWLACATAAVNFVCTFIGLFLVERVGRRSLTLWSLGGVVVSLVVLGIGFHVMRFDAPPSTAQGDGTYGTAMTCSECVNMAVECGFCYVDLPEGLANGSCWTAPEEPGLLPSHGPCSNHTAVYDGKVVIWAQDWCPSRFSWVAVGALGVYLLFFAPGMGPMPWTINSEIYPLWARSSCNSMATSVNWLFNLLISMTFLTLTEVLTKEGAFYLYAGFAGTGLVILILILPETKGKSLEDMETVFSKPWCMTLRSTDPKNVQYVHIRGLNRDCRED